MDGVIAIVSVAAVAFSYLVAPHGTKEPWFTDTDAKVEKLYIDGDKIVATPIMNADAAWAVCPNDYEVRREKREQRGQQTFLVWELRCR
jgi:hypothetical protein